MSGYFLRICAMSDCSGDDWYTWELRHRADGQRNSKAVAFSFHPCRTVNAAYRAVKRFKADIKDIPVEYAKGVPPVV